MKLEVLLQTYEEMQSPPPAPQGRPYTLLGTPPPLIQCVARAALELGPRSLVQGLTPEELWVSAIYYCQGVIRSNLVEGRIHFREMDAGMDALKSLVVGYSLPPISGHSPNVAFRFADVGVEQWRQVYTASKSSREGLLARVAMNFEGNQPVPSDLLKVIASHLVNETEVDASERDRKRSGDRDTLFVWLADRVSDVCRVTRSGALDSILKRPLQLKGVTAVAAAFSSLGVKLSPRRATRIFEENRDLLEQGSEFQYLLVPDFLQYSTNRAGSSELPDEAAEIARRNQMEAALQYVLSPDLGSD